MMKFNLILTHIFCISILIVAETEFIHQLQRNPALRHRHTYLYIFYIYIYIYIYEFWVVTSIAL